jgi:hypothetical protein
MRSDRLMRLIKFVAVVMATLSLLTETATAAASLTPRSKPQPTTAPKPQPTTGTVRIKIVKAGVIVGVGSGSGTLTYAGKTYQLTVGGISLGSLGVASVELAGAASNLRAAADIAGTYNGTGAGATLVKGRQSATLKNEKGVVLNLRGAQAGFQISLGLGGMTLSLQ